MGKLTFYLTLVLSTGELFAQQLEIEIKGDSLIIFDEHLTSNPFSFDPNSLEYLSRLKPRISKKPVENTHVDNKVDTIYTLYFSKDSFTVYKIDSTYNILLYADLTSTKFQTRHGIKVGMTKTEVAHLFPTYRLPQIPKYLVLNNWEVIEYFTIEFQNEKVVSIIFCGYID